MSQTKSYASVVADSISPFGRRVTTFEVCFHRFVLAEFNTHRVFSRNSASSRAIPLAKQIERVLDSIAMPVSFPMEQKGMQGGEEISERDLEYAQKIWTWASRGAVNYADELGRLGVHKSVANRLLEPFMWHTVVVTSTAWENYFALRCNPMAQPEIRVAAEAMRDAYHASTPRLLEPGQWHLPYIQDDEREAMPLEMQVQVSSARSARVSYLTQNGVRDFEQDVQLYDRLTVADPMHASPLEHPCTPNDDNRVTLEIKDTFSDATTEIVVPLYGNLLGFHQHRFDVEARKGYNAYAA